MGVANLHRIQHGITGEIPTEHPLVHLAIELVGLAAGGALFLTIIAEVMNRLRSHRSRHMR